MNKSELRKIYLAKRNSLTAAEQRRRSVQICDRLFSTLDLSSVAYLHCFISIAKFNEIHTGLIFERLWRDHPSINVLVPRVDMESGELQNLRFTPKSELIEAGWNIREPASRELVPTDVVDVVLVPLLCFDRRGHRVGYGKGYYDRFLASCRGNCQKIGLSYFPPVDEIEDTTSHDVRLDSCITPDEVLTIRES